MASTKTRGKTEKLLNRVLGEVRSLRRDVDLLLPTETLDEYEHPEHILAAYRRAIRKYPPHL